MKRVFAISAALLYLGITFSNAASAQTAQTAQTAQNPEELNIRQGVSPFDITPGSAQPTRGVVFFTATMNSNGSVASCFGCNTAKTIRVAVGRYIVDFGQNVQAINGWSRWVQPDTLQTGIIGPSSNPGAWCTTADSAADSNAVWVNCQHPGGPGSGGQSAFFDTSFFLFVAR
jgi:hypothetical protein